MHENIYAHYDSEREAYDALQRDAKQCSRQIQWMDGIMILAALYLCRHLAVWDYLAALALGVTAMQRLNSFIDNSNRNFFMHWLDWRSARNYYRSDPLGSGSLLSED